MFCQESKCVLLVLEGRTADFGSCHQIGASCLQNSPRLLGALESFQLGNACLKLSAV